MKLLGNILWLILGGFATAMGYFTASIPLFLSIIGIPFGVQAIKLGIVQLWPFDAVITKKKVYHGCLYTVLNIIWLLYAGIPIFLSHILFGTLLYLTIIGIPFARQHFKLSGLALNPFRKNIEYSGNRVL